MVDDYTEQTWTDGVSPRSAARFTHMEKGIGDAHAKHDETVGAADAAEVPTAEVTPSSSYTDLTTPGPSRTVEVGPTGRLKVTLGAQLSVLDGTVGTSGAADMSFEMTGPTPVAADSKRALILSVPDDLGIRLQASRSVTVTGLAPGTYTVTCKYRVQGVGQARFSARSLDVMPI